MSTVGDNLNFGGQVMLHDIYRRWIVRQASERHYLVAGKLCMLVILALAMTVVYQTRIIFDVAVFMLQLSSAELPANWAQWWWWRFNGKARIAASFGGGVIFCLVVLVPKLLVGLGVTWARALLIPWWYQTFIVMAVTTALWVCVALLTQPDSPGVLENFYRQACPLGSWGPVRDRISRRAFADARPPGQDWSLIGRGFIIALLGAAGVMLYILGVSNWFVGSNSLVVVNLIGATVLFAVFLRQLPAYLDCLEAIPKAWETQRETPHQSKSEKEAGIDWKAP
jgi:Na+/proline symporter